MRMEEGSLMAPSGPCPLDHIGPLVFAGRQDSELPSVSRLSWPLGYLTLSRFLRGAQRAERQGSDRGALCWPASPFSSLSWPSAVFLQTAHYCDGSTSPQTPASNNPLAGRSFPFTFLLLSLWILLSACMSTQNFVGHPSVHQSVHSWIPEERCW